MLSINTNLSSLIAQNSMKQSTNSLNQAIERMTTGYKLNHSKDNAANYSIATNMDTKIGAYMVAEDNVLSGLDLVSTANEVISLMEDRASRLSALSIQARNGTYGAKSLEALNSEAGALVSEIMRLYNSTQYNNVNLFNRSSFSIDENLPKAGESGFIEEPISTFAMRSSTPEPPTAKAEYGGFIENPYTYTDAEIAAMTALTDAVTAVSSGQKYSISNAAELENLAELVNSGVDTSGAIFVLGADIDLSSIANWTPIGTFNGLFDGNGHTILNLTTSFYNACFIEAVASTATVKNVKLENVNITGRSRSGGIAATLSGSISNCIVSGNIKGSQVGGIFGWGNGAIEFYYTEGNIISNGRYAGGIAGYSHISINNCYSTANITSNDGYVGGLAGEITAGIINSYATGNVSGASYVGGLAGYVHASNVSNCYALGDIKGTAYTGGLLGGSKATIKDCYASGNVTGTNYVGGFIGDMTNWGNISNSYALGNVNGNSYVGGFSGSTSRVIDNCYATGSVYGTNNYVGGFSGNSTATVSNSYSIGNVESVGNNVGGFVGQATSTLSNCYSAGSVKGVNNVGGFVGYASSALTTCYSTGDVTGEKFVGGLVGQAYKVSSSLTYTQCHAYGTPSGTEGVGGLIGGAVLTTDGTNFGAINTVGCQAVQQSADSIGGVYQYDSATTTYTLLSSYDMTSMNSGIEEYIVMPTTTTLHLGINGNESSSLSFDTNFIFDFSPMNSSVNSEEFANCVNSFVKHLQEKTTILGAVQNRLESALDEISTQYENLVSSRSTLRDADIADISSEYIRQQILQQASATLLSTANQSASIALSLI